MFRGRLINLGSAFSRNVSCFRALRKAELDPFAPKPPKPLMEMAYEDIHYGKEISPDCKLADALGESVGKARLELLSEIYGFDDIFDLKPVPLRRFTSEEQPHLVPTEYGSRSFVCMCEQIANNNATYTLVVNKAMRCKCGHWLMAVDVPTYNRLMEEEMDFRLEEIADTKEYKDYISALKSKYDKLEEYTNQCYGIDSEFSPEGEELLDKMYYMQQEIRAFRDEFKATYLID